MGVPPKWRPELWMMFSGAAFDRTSAEAYKSILEAVKVARWIGQPLHAVCPLLTLVESDLLFHADCRTAGRRRTTTLKRICIAPCPSTLRTSPRSAPATDAETTANGH